MLVLDASFFFSLLFQLLFRLMFNVPELSLCCVWEEKLLHRNDHSLVDLRNLFSLFSSPEREPPRPLLQHIISCGTRMGSYKYRNKKGKQHVFLLVEIFLICVHVRMPWRWWKLLHWLWIRRRERLRRDDDDGWIRKWTNAELSLVSCTK